MGDPHNFKNPEAKARAQYKLWVKYKAEFVNDRLPEIKVYYSYDKPGNPEYGKAMLLKMLRERIQKVQVAILYDNIGNTIITKFNA